MVRVTAGVIREGGRVLVCQRRRGGAFELKWEFPGGKVEDGEDPQACLARELREELGIEATVGPEVYRTRHRYPNGFGVELFFYRVEDFRGTPQNNAFEGVRWAAPAELPALDFLEADRELVALLAEGRL
jgi:8-oxo-dGTP diphosphatase